METQFCKHTTDETKSHMRLSLIMFTGMWSLNNSPQN
uniref:Uncharacterized protein n=1 Tax=Arundo donax TaxID=35708 RepID=A0A0A9C2N7_ARUDO